MTDQDDNPYSSPDSDGLPLSRECPVCGREMESGVLRSATRIHWYGDDESAWKQFLVGADEIGSLKSGIGCRYDAHFCRGCRILAMRDRSTPGDG